jgi:hypothetical protein
MVFFPEPLEVQILSNSNLMKASASGHLNFKSNNYNFRTNQVPTQSVRRITNKMSWVQEHLEVYFLNYDK